MVKARANDPNNHKLLNFSPQYFNIRGERVTYQEFIEERNQLMQPYLTQKEKRDHAEKI